MPSLSCGRRYRQSSLGLFLSGQETYLEQNCIWECIRTSSQIVMKGKKKMFLVEKRHGMSLGMLC